MIFKRNRGTSNDNLPSVRGQVSVIGAGMEVEGAITSTGELHIDGTVRGSVDADICLIGRSGAVDGSVRANELIVHGSITGPIFAGHVELHDGSNVEGDVVNGSIAMQSGAQLRGAVWHSDNPLGDSPLVSQGSPSGRSNSFLASPLWTGDDEAFRPLKVIKPR